MKLQPAITPKLVTQQPRKAAPQTLVNASDVVSASLSWLGGATSLVCGLSQNPMLMAAGAGAFALGSGMEAYRVNNSQNLDSQFALNVGVAGTLLVGGLALMFLTSSPTAATPVQQFFQQNPGLANLLS